MTGDELMRSKTLMFVLVVLTGCNGCSQAETGLQSNAAGQRESIGVTSDIPPDACTPEGYWSFFEAFTRSAEIRERYTATSANAAIRPFRIALVDDRWYYVTTGQGPNDELLDLKEERDGNTFRVNYIRAKLDANDELIGTYGDPGEYTFKFTGGCWLLVEAIP
jgi:hypothetical protein